MVISINSFYLKDIFAQSVLFVSLMYWSFYCCQIVCYICPFLPFYWVQQLLLYRICMHMKLINVCLYPHKHMLMLLFIGSKSPSVQVSSVPASEVPYTLSLCVRVSSTHPVSKVESNCSLDPLQYLNTEKTQTTVRMLLACCCMWLLFSLHLYSWEPLNNHRSSYHLDINLTATWSCWFITKMLTSPLHWWKQGRTLPSLVSLSTSPLCRDTLRVFEPWPVSVCPLCVSIPDGWPSSDAESLSWVPQGCDVFICLMWRICVLNGLLWKHEFTSESLQDEWDLHC